MVSSRLKKNKTTLSTTSPLARFSLRQKMVVILSMRKKMKSNSVVTTKKVQRQGHKLEKLRTKILTSRKKMMKLKG